MAKRPLAEYRAKRDFSKSPEPSGEAKPSRKKARRRFFCVQKHLASHLHYDFRLEHDGVLLSWAVPKGPSLDPAEKRLAMHVEDHPLDYGEFEGVIPEGYGAGIVMLWDKGTWEPEDADVGAALERGDLKMRLDGYKLKGSWVLVRTRRDEGRSWLLIKHRDEWSSPELDILEFAPLSVKSEGDFADILAQDRPDIWISNRPARGGEAGALFQKIVERALAIKQAREGKGARPVDSARTRLAQGAAGKKTTAAKAGTKRR
ncbi:MAG TPA: DNA polymerase ligase N-terminal domain-containing protein [Vicinamibacterales bacterium]|nr:DNA polymerase ligase N-terminal domain-containing protein [Vicinamibacterales bacterium]